MENKWSEQVGDEVVSFLSLFLFARAEKIQKTKTFIWLSGWKNDVKKADNPKIGPQIYISPLLSWSFPKYNMTTHIHIARPHWQFLSLGVEDMNFKDESSVQLK